MEPGESAQRSPWLGWLSCCYWLLSGCCKQLAGPGSGHNCRKQPEYLTDSVKAWLGAARAPAPPPGPALVLACQLLRVRLAAGLTVTVGSCHSYRMWPPAQAPACSSRPGCVGTLRPLPVCQCPPAGRGGATVSGRAACRNGLGFQSVSFSWNLSFSFLFNVLLDYTSVGW